MAKQPGPIGVFDSGYGGLTVFSEIAKQLPQYDYVYLGDNARVPYGTRSFETVYAYTLQCVNKLFHMGCNLVILACNTASAKALRSIQQRDLPLLPEQHRRVLGVIRPTAEIIGQYSKTGHIGLVATQGTVNSESYILETRKFFPDVTVWQEACPMWVPLVENKQHHTPGADYFIQQNLDSLLAQSGKIDTILLACTHYPLLLDKIKSFLPQHIQVVTQGDIVARSLAEYMQRHPEMDSLCTQNQTRTFYTTGSTADFNAHTQAFLGEAVNAIQLKI